MALHHARGQRHARAQGQVGQSGRAAAPPRRGGGPSASRMHAAGPMNGGRWNAVSTSPPPGMLAEQVRQDQIANDLANASTPGYKADRTTQRSVRRLLLAEHRRPARRSARSGTGVRDRPASGHRLHAQPLRTPASRSTSRSPATASSPSRPPQGVRYTRNGQFTAAAQRHASSTSAGNPVLGQNGRPITVGADGTVDPAHARRLRARPTPRKSGDNLFTGTAGGRGTGDGPLRRARGLGRRPRARDGRHDRLAARLRGRPEGHPDDRRDARARPPPRSARVALGRTGQPSAHRSARVSRADLPGREPQAPAGPHRGSRAPTRRPMLEGLYTAAAGMAAQQQRIDARRQRPGERQHDRLQARARRLPRPALRRTTGRARPGRRAPAPARPPSTIGRGFAQGAMRATGHPLDVAIQGEGFLRVSRADGTDRADARRRAAARRARPPHHQHRRVVQPAITVPHGHRPRTSLDRRRRHRQRRQPPRSAASSS